MHPIICKVGPFTVFSYGLMLAIAFVVASGLAGMYARRNRQSAEFVVNLCFIAFVCGIVGARIMHIIGNFRFYLADPLEIIMLQHGGLWWFGGLVFGTLGGVIYCLRARQPLYPTLDLIVPFAALAQSIGRIGCFLNGCCFGHLSGFGLYSEAHQAIIVPTQIYSSVGLLAIFVFLRYLQEQPHKSGQIFFAYLILYSVKRFAIEFWRGDSLPVFAGLTLFQLMSVAVFSLALGFYLSRAKAAS